MAERPFTPAESAQPAEWVVERLQGFAVNVLSIIPSGFEAYARVFHPASKVTCTADMAQSISEPLRWADVTELTGRTAHRTMQWANIQGSHPALNDYTKLKAGDVYIEPPEEGGLPLELSQTLWPIFERHTKTPDACFFAIREGFGGLPRYVYEAPAFEIPDRRFYLFSASLQTIEQSFYTGAEPTTTWVETLWLCFDEEEIAGTLQHEPEAAQLPPVEVLISSGAEQPTPEASLKRRSENLPPFDLPSA